MPIIDSFIYLFIEEAETLINKIQTILYIGMVCFIKWINRECHQYPYT